MSVSLTKLAKGKPTKGQIKRNEEKNERGICRIQKRCGYDQGFETVGFGSLVKEMPLWPHFEYAIITTIKVFQHARTFDIKKYRVHFKGLKPFKLNAVSSSIYQDPTSGLAVIPLNSDSSVFRRGLFKSSLLKHSPFKIEFLHENQRKREELCCHTVANHPSSNSSFVVETHELTEGASGQFTCNLRSSPSCVGAAILRRKVDKEWSLVGFLNSDSSDPNNFIWLSSEKFTTLSSGLAAFDGGDDEKSDDDDDDEEEEEEEEKEEEEEDCSDNDSVPGGEDGGNGVCDGNDDVEASSAESISGCDGVADAADESNHGGRSVAVGGSDHRDSGNGGDMDKKCDDDCDHGGGDGGNNGSDDAVDGNDNVFNALLRQIQHAAKQGFGNLKRECTSIKVPPLTEDMAEDIIFSNKVDRNSEQLMPVSLASRYVPLETTGDGNCFFRAASILAFGNENRHEEMRVRIVVELAVYSESYLKDKGIMGRIEAQERALDPGSKRQPPEIDPELVKTVFENDVVQTACRSSKASYWHLQALGNVLNRVVQSVYPECGRSEVRKYFNAQIWPRQPDLEKEPLAIMWTHTTGGNASNFIPNHFVPLISADKITSFRTEGSERSSVEHTEEIKQVKSVFSENENEIMKGGIQEIDLTDKDHELDARRNQLTNTRLSTKVSDIPFNIYSQVCLKLNIRDEMFFKDFRLLGEKLGYSKDMTRNLGQRSLQANPTDELLRRWSDSDTQATVEKLIELLEKDDFKRIDVVEILKECPQLSMKVTDVPFAIYSKVCLKLNIKDEMLYKGFRLLGEKLGYSKDVTRNLEQNSSRTNPTDELLQMWCKSGREATVGRLIELLKGDLERTDVVEILEDWLSG